MIDLKKLRIVVHPHKALRQKAESIIEVTDEIRNVANRMFQLMKQIKGMGLAAPQVGLPWRMFVMDHANTGPLVYINPTFTNPYGGQEVCEEACLSLPGILCNVSRYRVITISGLNQNGHAVSTAGSGLIARCFQHEVDHLDGILITDKDIDGVAKQ